MSSRGVFFLVGLIILLAVGGFFYVRSKSIPAPAASPALDSSLSSSSSPTPTDESATSAASMDKSSSETIIEVTSSGFSPQAVTIKAGGSVTWVNKDSQVHQVNSSPHPFHTDYPPLNTISQLNPGDKKSLTFPDKGVFKFHDHLNPKLFGSVTVE